MSLSRQPWLHELVTVLSAPTVALSDSGGQIRADGAQGVLHGDLRVLSEAVLTLGGSEPDAVGASLTGARTARFTCAARGFGDLSTADPTVLVERSRTVSPGEVAERVLVASYASDPVVAELTLTVAADLADVALIKAGRASGPGVALRRGATGLVWGTGPLRVTLSAPGAVISLSAAGAVLRWPVRLAGRGVQEVSWRLSVTERSAGVAGVAGGVAGALPARAGIVRSKADDRRLPALLDRSLADVDALRMTLSGQPDDVFLAAGAPWFFTLFGRDSIWAARLLLPFGWQLAAGTLRVLASLQGRVVDAATAEAPGKIPHEIRRGGSVYYGTIDATPLWICLLRDAWRWGMPDEQVRALLPNLVAALDWMDRYGDSDGDGFLEYIDASGGHGLANQGWKDSGDAIRFADGRAAAPPVALCEVQGYAHEAAIAGAELLAAFCPCSVDSSPSGPGSPSLLSGGRWREWAAKLAVAFRASFWVDGYPALALDADKRRVDSLTSNIGHLLGTGLLTAEEEALVAQRLSGDDMNSGFGLRTMSSSNAGFNPLSYHCGSVWSHDTAIVVRGLFRAGHAETAAALADGLLAAAAAFDWRLPELFAGSPRAGALPGGSRAGAPPGQLPAGTLLGRPVPYPAACRPQAWSAAAAGALVQGLLGLEVNVPGGTVAVRPPGVRLGSRLHVDGLVAGTGTFSAGVDRSGNGYARDCGLRQTR